MAFYLRIAGQEMPRVVVVVVVVTVVSVGGTKLKSSCCDLFGKSC